MEQASVGTAQIVQKRNRGMIIQKILEGAEKWGIIISAFLIFVMMILTTLDTTLRDTLNKPIEGVYELHTMFMVGVLYLGLAYAQSKRSHIRMDALSSRLNQANQILLQLIGDVIFLIIAALITWQVGVDTFNAWITQDFYYGVVQIPLWPAKMAITVGTGLLCLRLIWDITNNPLWFSKSILNKNQRYQNIAIFFVVSILLAATILIIFNLKLNNPSIFWIVIALFFVLLFLGLPVAASMCIIGILGIGLLSGSGGALNITTSAPFASSAEYTMTVVPLFIVMGTFASLAGFAESGFDLAKRWLLTIKGGIVYASIAASVIFAAATGSGAASCVVLTKLTLPEMLKAGVNKGMAIGVIASASTLAIMIPPSTSFVIYAMLTGNSVSKLLMSGIIPGLIGAAMIAITVYLRCLFNPSLVQTQTSVQISWKDRLSAIPRAWGIALVMVIIIGGIMTGFFTPTEAGAIGAFATFVAVLALRKGGWKEISGILVETAGITAIILFILVGGKIFGTMISITRMPNLVSEWIVGLNVAPIMIVIIIMIIYFILGCFMDSLSIMIITLPIVYPVIIHLGFDPIWFGVLQVQNLEISTVTPPYGMNLFILKGVLPGTGMGEIMKGSLWFVIPMIITMAIYIIFPQVTTWLPNLMSG
jgi:C4-dicarboxylate transporter, DctM subunit